MAIKVEILRNGTVEQTVDTIEDAFDVLSSEGNTFTSENADRVEIRDRLGALLHLFTGDVDISELFNTLEVTDILERGGTYAETHGDLTLEVKVTIG